MWKNRLAVSAPSAILSSLFVLLAAIVFSDSAFAKPLASGPTHVGGSEVSIAQVPAGMTLRFTRRRPVIASTHPHPETETPLRKMAEAAATAHTLPVTYFLRLIRQESGFDPNSVSRAGAQGIAQFMPGTAFARGLKDPFDPAEALPKSAELLNELKDHFGNLGLAAAAYNAGPEWIRRWLAGETQLPQETINYVRVITGHDAADWAKSNDLAINLSPDAFEPSSRLHLNRLSWEAQLLATLRATSADGSAISVSTALTRRMGEASLCSHCIVQTAY
jgi:soluble lytic murein transglycosylase-like protein